MDRSKVPLAATIVNCQIGFINVLVRPLLSEWATFLGAEAERDVISSLEGALKGMQKYMPELSYELHDMLRLTDRVQDLVGEVRRHGRAD